MGVDYRRMVVPVDGGIGDDRVLTAVRLLADRRPVTVTLVYVVEVLQSMPLDAELPAEVARGEAVLRAAEAATRAAGCKTITAVPELLQARSSGAAIVDEAIDRDADVIVMAAHTRRALGHQTVGDTVGYVLKNAPCEVVVVRSPLANPANGGA